MRRANASLDETPGTCLALADGNFFSSARSTMSIHPVAKTLLVVLSVWGAQQVLQARRRRAQTMRERNFEAEQAWEGEGGAVPVSSHRTAAEVTPTQSGRSGAL
jgi:hypothetical protein